MAGLWTGVLAATLIAIVGQAAAQTQLSVFTTLDLEQIEPFRKAFEALWADEQLEDYDSEAFRRALEVERRSKAAGAVLPVLVDLHPIAVLSHFLLAIVVLLLAVVLILVEARGVATGLSRLAEPSQRRGRRDVAGYRAVGLSRLALGDSHRSREQVHAVFFSHGRR